MLNNSSSAKKTWAMADEQSSSKVSESQSSDARLVKECLGGNEAAWSALIGKYKNLIFSVPLKFGLSRDQAADIFQAVCLDLLIELSRLRNFEALPAWLIKAAHHRCLRFHHKQRRYLFGEIHEKGQQPGQGAADFPEQAVWQVERRQILHQALSELPPRCRQLVQMLFFETPSRPYRELSGVLGVARGSIGFIRGRCLERLRKRLETAGFDRQ
jgi:RNA polymerase sigma factor (sigma-70 family)